MSIGSILIGMLLLAALAAAAARPWWRSAARRPTRTAADPRLEYEALVATIRDLDFDYRAGVVTETDYRPLRDDLAARAASLLQELDRGVDDETDLEMQIEAAVSALRHRGRAQARAHPDGAGASICPECGHQNRAGSRFCARCGTVLGLTCPDCDGPVEPEDRFCATCGRPLLEEVPTT